MSRLEGDVAKGYGSVAKVLASQIDETPGGAAVCVYHNGKKVVDIWGGRMNRKGDPWLEDTLSISFSTTKGVTATLLHIMADRGLVRYDDKVAKYWPEFAEGGKDNITIRHLLTHTANLYNVRDLVESPEQLFDWEEVTSRLAATTPPRGPTNTSTYHAMTYGWLVGEVVRRVLDKRPFWEIVQSELAKPLGLDGLFVGVPDDQHHRVAELIMGNGPLEKSDDPAKKRKIAKQKQTMKRMQTGLSVARKLGLNIDTRSFTDAMMARGFAPRMLNEPDALRASMPAVNGAFTARSLAKMYAALANGGEFDGVRLMSEETLSEATRHHVGGVDHVIPIPMNWRLGYHQPFILGRRPKKGFGHFGFGGSGGWACPERNLSVALTVNSGTGSPWGDMRIARIGRAAVKSAEKMG